MTSDRSWLRGRWEAFTEPHPSVTDITDQLRVRLLAGTLLAFVAIVMVAAPVQLILVPSFSHVFLSACVLVPTLVIAYVASRSRYYKLGCWIGSLIPILTFVFVATQDPLDRAWYAFLLAGVLVASILLPILQAALVGGIAFLALIATVVALPQLHDIGLVAPMVTLHVIFSPALVLAAGHRNRLERERLAARLAIDEQIRESRRLETLGRLSAGVAHDFNNLLTVIFANVGLAKIDPSSQGQALSQIEVVGERAAELTRQLLAYARREVLEPEVVSLNPVLTRVESMLQRVLGEDVELEVEKSTGVAPVRVDESRFEQVVMNLALNARDAMPEGGCLRISLREAVRAGQDHAMIEVSDSGEGMTAEICEQIFEPFFTTKADGKGTGLGLAMAKGFVSQSGGHLGVSSVPGQGSKFQIWLPCVDAAAVEPALAKPRFAAVPGHQAKVLLIEDQEAVREVNARLLKCMGYRVLAVASGDKALELDSHDIDDVDVIVSDVLMPGMRGPAAVGQLLSRMPGRPVLYVSGHVDKESLGDAAFLAKPFTPTQLSNKLALLLGPGDGANAASD